MSTRKPSLAFLGLQRRSQAKPSPKRSSTAAPWKGFAEQRPRALGPADFAPAPFQGLKEPQRRPLTEAMQDFLERRGMAPAGGDAASSAARPQRRSSLAASMRARLERQGIKPNERNF